MRAASKRFDKHFPLIRLPNVDSGTGNVHEPAFINTGAVIEGKLVGLAAVGADEFGPNREPGTQIGKKRGVAAVLVLS